MSAGTCEFSVVRIATFFDCRILLVCAHVDVWSVCRAVISKAIAQGQREVLIRAYIEGSNNTNVNTCEFSSMCVAFRVDL